MIYLCKQQDGFSYSNYIPQNEDDELLKSDDFLVVDEKIFENLKQKRLMWNNGELVDNPDYNTYIQAQEAKNIKRQKKDRIAKLKSLLAETDYRAIKYAEGLYTEEEYAPYKVLRQSYRDEINQLEEELNAQE